MESSRSSLITLHKLLPRDPPPRERQITPKYPAFVDAVPIAGEVRMDDPESHRVTPAVEIAAAINAGAARILMGDGVDHITVNSSAVIHGAFQR